MKKVMIIIISCFLITLVIISANDVLEKTSSVVETAAEQKTSEEFIADKRPEEWAKVVFVEDEVIEVKLYIDEQQYDYMVENASSELYVPADIVYNGITIKNIGIRPKGNSSLREAISAGKEQFSFKLKFDKYLSQDLYGIKAIGLNNCFSDASYIREIMSYEMIEEMGLPTPGTTFCNVYINDELAGLYLSVQQIDEVFTAAWFNDGDGDLFKPEGIGADLVYIDDAYSSYSGLSERTNVDDDGEAAVVEMIKALSTGKNLEEVLYVDLVLKYHALNTAMLSLDSYMGGMFHNYYLYGEDGKYMIIPWDYNMSFGGFGSGTQQTLGDETQFYIDEPTSGAMENYPLINTLLKNEDYLQQYHEYLTELITGPLEIETFTARAEELTALIDEYIKNDPEPMSSYEAFHSALYGTENTEQGKVFDGLQTQEVVNEKAQEMGERLLLPVEENNKSAGALPQNTSESLPEMTDEMAQRQNNRMNPGGMGGGPALLTFVENWTENIQKQLSGERASTNNGEGNQAGMMSRGNMGDERKPQMLATGEGSGTAYDPSPMMVMAGGRPPIDGQPPEGMPGSNRPRPLERMQLPRNYPLQQEGMNHEAMNTLFENQKGAPNDFKQASIGFLLVGADTGKYLLIILTAFVIIFFASLIKRKH